MCTTSFRQYLNSSICMITPKHQIFIHVLRYIFTIRNKPELQQFCSRCRFRSVACHTAGHRCHPLIIHLYMHKKNRCTLAINTARQANTSTQRKVDLSVSKHRAHTCNDSGENTQARIRTHASAPRARVDSAVVLKTPRGALTATAVAQI